MASLSLPRVLSHRRSGSIEVERETFWKSQTSSIGKAINQQETPVKEKHVRSAIIGTYHEKGGTTFWAVVGTLPIQENPIVCWKFCHTLHKLLREGHPNVLPESQAYRQRLRELGKYWGHLRHNFGRLISCYCRLLATKLDFHSKNPKFPGNLQLTNEQLEAIGEMDINNYFQVTVEMFDFMDEILTLQTAVFGSLETGRANSMTMSGQCRLAPLIPCIQDSSHLYDYLVKLLFKLHSSLPPDVLVGHRDRFYKQFKVLRDFYRNASILQYFKHLIQIPLLPEDPPNFLIKSEIHSHVSPVVILPPQDDSVDTDSVDMSLIDTTSPPLLEIEPTNGASSPDINSDKDRLIERLQQEIERLKREIQRIRMEDQVLIDELRHQLAAVQGKLSAQQQQLLAKNGEIELLRTKAVAAEKNVQAAEKLVEVEKKSKANEDKFQKMKDVYYKLREEHIALLRAKADVEKQLVGAKQASDTTAKSAAAREELKAVLRQLEEAKQYQSEMEKKNKELETMAEIMVDTQHSRRRTVATLDRAADENDSKRLKVDAKQKLGAAVEDRSRLEAMLRQSVDVNKKLSQMLKNEHQLQMSLMDSERNIDKCLASKSTIEGDLEKTLERCSSVIGQLNEEEGKLSTERMEMDRQLAILADEQMELESNFHHNPQQSKQKLEMLKKTRDHLEAREAEISVQLQQVVSSKQSAESELNETMESSRVRLAALENDIDKLQLEKSELKEKLELTNSSKSDLTAKLAAIEALLAERSADSQDMDELLMMAVDEMYLAQNRLDEGTEHDDKLIQLEQEKQNLQRRVNELENNANKINEVKVKMDSADLAGEEYISTQEISIAKIQEEKNKINAEKRDLEDKLVDVLSEEEKLEEALHKNRCKQQLGVFAEAEDDEKRELEEMLLAAIDENYIAQQLMDDNSADSDQRFRQFETERKALRVQIMLLEGKLENALNAKCQIEDSFKGSSDLSAQEIAKLIEIKNELDNRVRAMTDEMQKIEEANDANFNQDLMLDNSELEELLMEAVDEAHVAEQMLQEQSQGMEDQFSTLNQERMKLKNKILELEGRLTNLLEAKSSIESAFLNSASTSAAEISQVVAAKNELEEKTRDVTEQLQKMLLEREEATKENVESTSRLENNNKALHQENSLLEERLKKVKEEKIVLETALQSNQAEARKQLDKMAEKYRELDLDKQELEEMLLTALDEKYMTEQTASEEAEQREQERLELIQQHKVLKLKSMELEGRLANALNAKSLIERAYKESSSHSGQEMVQVIQDKEDLEYQLRETLEKLEKALVEKEAAEKRAQEKVDEVSKRVSELLREKQELELKNLGLEESLALVSSEKAVFETNLQHTSERLAKELEYMEQKHGDLDMEKQELEEMLLAAVDETYMAEQLMQANSLEEEAKTQLIQERNLLRRKVMELEGKLENAQAAKSSIQQAFQDNSAKLGQQVAYLTNEKYILEDEILNLRMQLSGESDARMQSQQTQLDSVEKLAQELKGNVSVLEQQLLEVTEQKINLEQQVADLTGNVARLESEVDSVKKDSDEGKLKSSQDKKQRQFEILVSCLEEAEDIVRNALKTVDDDSTAPLTCSPEYLLKCGGSVLETLERLKRENHSFNQDHQSDIDALLRSVTAFSHLLSQFLIEGKATFNATADIEQGTQLVKACKDSGNDTLLMLASMKIMDNAEEVETNLKKVGEDVKVACDAVESLISLSAAKVEDRIEDLVERELAEMDRAIEEAASRIAEILSKSRQAETGVKLEVSEKILDTCTALMASIRELVKRSKELQLEIVAQGKGHKSAKEFYKKNHQWTEGLLSAAKAVGMGAKFLVDAADKVVTGQAKFELLVAASQEIAASTAQLVVASKVKADPGSKNLTELSRASNTVRGCTGTVVATVKDCAQMIDDADVMDFSGLSLHQAKRLEMESQVRVLELETSLEKERVKLSTLRKRHYTLAGTGAGWEQQEEVVNN